MRKGLAAAATTSVMVLTCGAVVGAAPASASTTWIQSVQRPSQDAACPVSSGPAPQSGWVVTDWTKSWEQWANGGRGGWTCTRTIIWGKGSGGGDRTPPPLPEGNYPPGVGCVSENGSDGYIDFLGGFYLEAGAPVWFNASCTNEDGVTYSNPRIYAPAGYDAQALCQEFANLPYANGPYGQDTWDCDTEPSG